MVRGPHDFDLVLFEMHEAGRVHVGQLGATESVQHLEYVSVLRCRGVEHPQVRQIRNELTKGARMLLAHAVQKPRVRFGNDED